MTKTAFIYTDEFSRFDYGDSHPLRIFRLKLTYELIKSYGLLSLPNTCFIESRAATDDELILFHSQRYLEILKIANEGRSVPDSYAYGFGFGDNPIFKGLLDWSRLLAGSSLQAAEMVENGEVDIAFNISGGLHHARKSQASGFCYVNDPVIAIKYLLKKGRRVAYVDIDAHHGDGVQEAFYDTDKVLTVSIHETGRLLFPGTGFESEIGVGKGEGYSINVPLPPYSDDEIFLYAFNEIVPPALDKFKPDIVVTQLGVDTFRSDPLAHLELTSNGFCQAVVKLKEISEKWVALGGGGYDIYNVARGWTLAWAIMNDVELPDQIPQDFLQKYSGAGFSSDILRDSLYLEKGSDKQHMKNTLKGIISLLHEKALPKIKKI
jgi:acetoin utilization protein AcuC